MKKIKKSKLLGFTLIELLIVIALLGALAVGLLAGLDPFEQFKKGSDSAIRNTVSELHGAFIRYYAINNSLPWYTQGYSGYAGGSSVISNYINSVIQTGELKSDFFQLAEKHLNNIYINATAEQVTVCFQPKSKSFRSDPNTKYKSDGSDQPNCPNPNSSSCHWCVR